MTVSFSMVNNTLDKLIFCYRFSLQVFSIQVLQI